MGLISAESTARGANWPAQRRKALARDKQTCQQCGCCERAKLQVHHKKPYRCYATTQAANRITNLITLCVRCHTAAEALLRKNNPPSHPDWRPKTDLRGTEWPAVRKRVLARDKNTCRECGHNAKKGMHIHHIIPIYVFVHMRGLKQVNDMENLETLCAPCHVKMEAIAKLAYPPTTGWMSPALRILQSEDMCRTSARAKMTEDQVDRDKKRIRAKAWKIMEKEEKLVRKYYPVRLPWSTYSPSGF